MFNLRKIGWTAMVNTRNMAGHSKWANIKHIKEAKDNERAKIHSRITRLIRITIRGKKIFCRITNWKNN